jgi:exopolysaccharide production protein ExoZ
MHASAETFKGTLSAERVIGFDLLRGVCAIAVLVYHVFAWNGWGHLYNWGTYGVYIFFCLSGASMYIAYRRRLGNVQAIHNFLVLRLVRLMPLYILALILSVAINSFKSGFDLRLLAASALNIFFLFGLGNPGATSQVTGGWSLGIEFIFYLIFPVLLSLMRSKRMVLLMLSISLIGQHLFISIVFENGQSLVANWVGYTQFLSFSFYFVAGCAIGWLLSERKVVPFGSFLTLGFILIIGLSSGSVSEETLVGPTGICLSIAAVLAVAASSSIKLGEIGIRISDLLGRCSYGIYILHPLVAGALKQFSRFIYLNPSLFLVLAIFLTLVLSLFAERFVERPIQKAIKKRLVSQAL